MDSGEGSVHWYFFFSRVFDDLANDAADIQGEDRHALAVAQGPEGVLVIEECFEHGRSPKKLSGLIAAIFVLEERGCVVRNLRKVQPISDSLEVDHVFWSNMTSYSRSFDRHRPRPDLQAFEEQTFERAIQQPLGRADAMDRYPAKLIGVYREISS